MKMGNVGLTQQFITGVSMILIFISLKASPFDKYLTNYWMVGLILGILAFVFSPKLARKANGVE